VGSAASWGQAPAIESLRAVTPVPTDTGGQAMPGDDPLGQILSELDKAIREGRLKPVVLGPYEINIPGQAGPAGPGQPQTPGGNILGQILGDVLGGGAGGQVQVPRQGVGAAVFGDRLEAPAAECNSAR